MHTLNNAKCQIKVAPERGAIVTSLQVNGVESLYLDQSTFDDPAKNVRGGIPVLFPLCGPQSEPATMKQHGFARNSSWTVGSVTEESIQLSLQDSPQTLDIYPYPFQYLLTYRALPDGLRIEQSIENRGSDNMPLQFGFHPYFLVGSKERIQFQLPVTTYCDNKSDDRGTFQGFPFQRSEIDWAFPNPTELEASFHDPERNLTIKVSYGNEYTQLVFWTLENTPFVCVEPWSSARWAYPNGPDLHQIKPGETINTQVEIRVS